MTSPGRPRHRRPPTFYGVLGSATGSVDPWSANVRFHGRYRG
jgi:hypothetical protein